MKNTSILFGIIGVLVIGGIAVFASKNTSPLVKNESKYCGENGTLTNTMPIQSHRSYCVKSNASEITYIPNTPAAYSFSIVDDEGNTLKDFAVTHTKQMHVIVVRKDLAYFQHLHPDYDTATGIFTLSNLNFPTDGSYRIFADFAPEGGIKDPEGMPLGVTISEDVSVGDMSAYKPVALGPEERSKVFDGVQVKLSTMPQTLSAGASSMLTFSLSSNSKPVIDLQVYLGALGHSVLLREGTLDFIHTHPMNAIGEKQSGKVEFMVTLPQPGKYKVFTQFMREDKVLVTDYILEAKENSSMSENMHPMPDGTMMHN